MHSIASNGTIATVALVKQYTFNLIMIIALVAFQISADPESHSRAEL